MKNFTYIELGNLRNHNFVYHINKSLLNDLFGRMIWRNILFTSQRNVISNKHNRLAIPPFLYLLFLIFSSTSALGAQCPCSIWDNSTKPKIANVSDTSGVELGVKFKSQIDGQIKSIRFYKGINNTGRHIGNLWTSTGKLLATAVFTNETATGWQQVNFSTPVPITANAVYIASYYAPNGHYAEENYFFKNSKLVNPPLELLKNTAKNRNSVYAYGPKSSFPKSSYRANNYWVDVVFIVGLQNGGTVKPSDTTSPSVPANIAAIVKSNSQISVSWKSSTDNVGVTGYRIFRNGIIIGTTSGLSFNDTGLSASTTYSYQVAAFDAAGNNSGKSQKVSATTKAASTAPPPPPPSSSFQPSSLPYRYTWGILNVGKLAYVDRSYKYTTVPIKYAEQYYIRTANNDKRSTGNAFLNFDVNVNVTVYVAHDIRISPKPTWLGRWTNTGKNLVTNDTTLRLYSKVFTAGSVTLGGNSGPSASSMYEVVVVPLNNTTGGNNSVPIAKSDSISMEVDTSANINVLVNDSGLADTPVTVSVVTAPGSGLAVRNADNTITYTPNSGFSGQDSFNYKVTDQNGDTGLTTVNIQVNCTSCTTNKLITLSWNHSDPNSVDGYKIYAGPTAQNSVEVADVSTMGLANPQTPSVDFLSSTDLGLKSGDKVCFRAKAYNAFGSSSFSTPVCTNI
jgi:uncharacterized protein DUF4082/Big-like domain-containing protein/fibronectin type III domain protein